MICVSVFFIRSALTISENPQIFSQSGGKNNQNYITFKYSADGIRNKYYQDDPEDYDNDKTKLGTQAQAIIKSEITDILAGNKIISTTEKTYAVTDYTFTADPVNYAVNVSGSFLAIKSLTSLENKYYMPTSSKNIVTITDQYGRPMFYGEKYITSTDDTKMLMDPTGMMSPTFTFHTKSIPQQSAAIDGKNLWEISGNGKYWGKELKGSVFSNASVASSTNSKFDHISFTLSTDGFFTAFTQYLNIMLSDYKYHHQKIGNVYSTDYNAKKGSSYTPNANPKTDEDINNVYIQSLPQYQPILIWINQARIFTVTHTKINSVSPIKYTFKWTTDNAVGSSFKAATHAFIYNVKPKSSNFDDQNLDDDNKPRTAGNIDKGTDLDPSGNYWYYGHDGKDEKGLVQKASGFDAGDDAPNFLDLGFDHLTAFALDAPGLANAKKSDTSKNPKNDVINKFVTNQWNQSKLLPYKNADGKVPNADFLNTNYNQPHIFTDPGNKEEWFSIAYGQTDFNANGPLSSRTALKHEKNKDDVVKKENSYPFLVTPALDAKTKKIQNSPYESYYGYVSNDGKTAVANDSSRLLEIANQVNDSSGLVGVVSVRADSSNATGLKAVSFQNKLNSKLADDDQHDYYDTANWGAFIPIGSNLDYKPPDSKVKLPPDQTQKSIPIASYYGLNASRTLNLTTEFAGGIRYTNTSTSVFAVNVTLAVIGGIVLLTFFLYIIFRYKLLSIMIVIIAGLFVMITVIFMENSKTQFSFANISVMTFGLVLLLLSIDISISVFRKRTIAFFRNASDKLVISRSMIILFLNYFALIFIESILLATRFGQNSLTVSLILMAAMTVIIFLLVPVFLIFYLQTTVINKNYEADLDNLTLKALKPTKYSYLDKLVNNRGLAAHINGRKQLLSYLAKSHNQVLITNSNQKRIRQLTQLTNTPKAVMLTKTSTNMLGKANSKYVNNDSNQDSKQLYKKQFQNTEIKNQSFESLIKVLNWIALTKEMFKNNKLSAKNAKKANINSQKPKDISRKLKSKKFIKNK